MSLDAAAVATQLRDLAKVPQNRGPIVRDQGCLPGLVLLLGNPEQTVVDVAVEALGLLAECEGNRNIMWNELGLVISLNGIIDAVNTAQETRDIARKTISTISPAPMPKPAVVCATPLRKPFSEINAKSNKGVSASFFKVKNVNTTARTVSLQLKGLNDLHTRKVLEDALLHTKGIVSFTIDMVKSRAAIRARNETTVEQLCQAVRDTKLLDAQQVVKDDEGREVILSFGTAPHGETASPAATKSRQPRYLDEEMEHSPVEGDNAIAVTDGITTGISNWVSNAASFVSKTLYW
eukprot:m.14196 g.14196  ORF g.14196 m.14196 type:complete len:293 (+) comp10329_c0_seq2:124-1002(+)